MHTHTHTSPQSSTLPIRERVDIDLDAVLRHRNTLADKKHLIRPLGCIRRRARIPSVNVLIAASPSHISMFYNLTEKGGGSLPEEVVGDAGGRRGRDREADGVGAARDGGVWLCEFNRSGPGMNVSTGVVYVWREGLLVGVDKQGLEVGDGCVEAGEADGALAVGVCDWWVGVWSAVKEEEERGGGGGLRMRGSEEVAYLRSPMKTESAEP